MGRSSLYVGVESHWIEQRVGQVVVVPCGWTAFRIYHGAGVHVAAWWRILRSQQLVAARRHITQLVALALLSPVFFYIKKLLLSLLPSFAFKFVRYR